MDEQIKTAAENGDADMQSEIIPSPEKHEEIEASPIGETHTNSCSPPYGRTRKSRAVLTAVCAVFCVFGLATYVILGISGIDYIKNGGFLRAVARFVYDSDTVVSVPPAKSTETEETLPDVTEITEAPIPAAAGVVSENLAAFSPLEVYNETAYGIDAGELLKHESFVFGEGSKVLVVHTHATESYLHEGCTDVADECFRSDDPEENMIAVGSVFCSALEARGIKTVHCTEMFDRDSYTESYAKCAGAVAKYVESDPDIKLVFDLHRDAVVRDDGSVVRTDGDGKAQLMLIAGTDEGGADFPDWRDNLAFALRYQSALYSSDPNLVRHVNLRGVSFNEQLAPRYLLMEVGCIGNTLTEAEKCAAFAADILADILLG